MPEWARKLASTKFNASCKIHDLDYDSKKFSRLQADTRFLAHMLRQAEDSLLWELVAVWYFVIVRTLGRLSWLGAK